MNAYTIRPEQEHEFPAIHALIKDAFATATCSL
jgi:predicted N-acetyltransferase YhbS